MGALWDFRMSELVSSFRMKQSSSPMIFSPMHTVFENRFAVDLGSNPLVPSQHACYDHTPHFLFIYLLSSVKCEV